MLNVRSSVRNRILNFFFLNESSRVYINELARQIQADPKNVYRMLIQLEQEGILASEFKGKERYFFSRKDNSFYKGFKEIFLKTAGVEVILKQALAGVAALDEAYLFGSYAERKHGPESDIDVLLVGEHSALEAEKVLYRIQKQIGREITAVNMKSADFKKRRARGDQFIDTVFSGKVVRLL